MFLPAAKNRPVRHQQAALLEQIATPVSGFDFAIDCARQRYLYYLIGKLGRSAAQSRKVERKPWAVRFDRSMRSSNLSIALLLSGLSRVPPGNQPTRCGAAGRPRSARVAWHDSRHGWRGIPLNLRWVFWHGGGERYQNVASKFSAITARVITKVKREGKEFRRFRFHDLRHCYAVDYMRSGGSIYALQQILGHSSITTTEIYLDYLTLGEQACAMAGTLVGTEAAVSEKESTT